MSFDRLFHFFGEYLLATGVNTLRTSPEQGDAAIDLYGGKIAGKRVANTVYGAEGIIMVT
mgnify:CR=1 FL=1